MIRSTSAALAVGEEEYEEFVVIYGDKTSESNETCT